MLTTFSFGVSSNLSQQKSPTVEIIGIYFPLLGCFVMITKKEKVLTWLLRKIKQIATPTKWGILRPPCILGGYYPPTTDHIVWGSLDPPMEGYRVILPQYRGKMA